ncbi:MAG: nucleotide sugar dehydrogenase, partial [Xanthomonadales bacterium]|nr:nucleotide sugar dehydrogenase [Xanthomonadales bacterium]
MPVVPLPLPDDTRPAVIGLGYVGLPLAVGFGREIETLGFDINRVRVAELQSHRDHTLEVSSEELKSTAKLRFSA